MRTIRAPLFPVLAVLVLAVAGARAEADSPARSCVSAKEVRDLVDKAEVVPAARAIQQAKAFRPGEAVKVRLCKQGADWLYLVTMLAKDGKIRILEVDARSGTLIERH